MKGGKRNAESRIQTQLSKLTPAGGAQAAGIGLLKAIVDSMAKLFCRVERLIQHLPNLKRSIQPYRKCQKVADDDEPKIVCKQFEFEPRTWIIRVACQFEVEIDKQRDLLSRFSDR